MNSIFWQLVATMLAVLCAAPVMAQTIPTPAGGAPAAAATPGPGTSPAGVGFLWDARKGSARILLMGTIHVGQAAPAVANWDCGFRGVQAIALEADITDARAVGETVRRMGMFAEGEAALDTRLPADLKQRIETLLPRYGLPPAVAWRFKPWMLGNTVTILEAARSGYSAAFATELALSAFAQRCNKPLVEIEGLERQLSAFEGASPALQIRVLDRTVASVESGAALTEMRTIVGAWNAGDEVAMQSTLTQMRASGNEADRFVVESLIDGRHPHMVYEAQRLAASGRLTLFAVGSLHYFGKGGLLERLRAAGYTITPLR